MIASLSGVIQSKALDSAVVDVGGVGYHVRLSSQTVADLPPPGDPVRLLCHTHVREDALQLYGFGQQAEQQSFELLIRVAGVGPKLALTILSGMAPADLIDTLSSGDHRRLQSIPGVGKRTAERLVVELKDQFAKLAASTTTADEAGRRSIAQDDVVEALVNLGYRRALAERAVSEVGQRRAAAGETIAPESLLRAALSAIAEL